MALKKSELYSSIWKSCDELRGGMDASQYKDYVLVLLFVKYVSDKYANDPDALIEIPAGGSFADMVAAKGHPEIGDSMNKIIARLADANDNLKGAINVADFNDEDKLGKDKEMVDRLSKLVAIFEGLDFGRNRADGDDLLGDAYEYLMRHFATESGKSKGQFYTPAEVSRVMSMVIGLGSARDSRQTIYDPTCGSGSLLLKAHGEAKTRTGLDLALYGQEMDNATSAMARMNMVLHGCPTAEIRQGNTLSAPLFVNPDGTLKTFDYVVANPPFSNKNWTSGLDAANDRHDRFEYGIPPDKNGDYAFLLHMVKSLKSTGKAAIILPHGVLFRGGAEAEIRTRIIRQGFIKGIIGLPANLFYGTGIPACIIVLDKADAAARKGIFMIDASRGFIKDGNKNRLRAQDIHKIVDTFTRLAEQPRYSRMVPLHEIEGHGYNLNLPRYIDSTEPEDLQDIEAHLKGGIPHRDIDALAPYWAQFPTLRAALFTPAERPGYSLLAAEPTGLRDIMLEHPEFRAYSAQVLETFGAWRATATPLAEGIAVGYKPKQLIETLSENLLKAFEPVPLISAYDVYQHLMDYWETTMQDDVYLLAADGWAAATTLRELIPARGKNGKPKYNEPHDFVVGKVRYKADIIPPSLVIARYFAADLAAIETLEEKAALLEQQMEDLIEEHGGEGGLLEVVTEGGRSSVDDRLDEIGRDRAFADERKMLETFRSLMKKAGAAARKAANDRKVLEANVFAKYSDLSEGEAKALVVHDKWMHDLTAALHGELDRTSQSLAGRIRQLAERYATPLPALAAEVEVLSARVDEHLRKMGFVWN